MLSSPHGAGFSCRIVRVKGAEYTRCGSVLLFGHRLAENFLHVPKLLLMETKTQIDTTKSEEVVRKHREYIWPAVANFYEHPLVADRAWMQYVWDLEGRKYLDFSAAF